MALGDSARPIDQLLGTPFLKGAPYLSAQDLRDILVTLYSGTAVRPQTIALLGDSITANCSTSQESRTFSAPGTTQYGYNGNGYWCWANQWLKHRVKLVANRGLSGDNLSQILARVPTEILTIAPTPGWCLLHGGTNDINDDSRTLGQMQQATRDILAQLSGDGVRPIATSILPSTFASTAARQLKLYSYNKWLQEYCATNGIVFCDWHAAVADPATANFLATLSADSIHPNGPGAFWLARALFDTLDPILPRLGRGATTNLDLTNLLAHPLFDGTGGTPAAGVTGSVATGWTAQFNGGTGTGAATKVARTDGVQGSWQQVAVTVDAGGAFDCQVLQAGVVVTPNTSIYATCDYEFDADWANARYFSLGFFFRDGGGTIIGTVASYDGVNSAESQSLPALARTGVFRTPVQLVPANAATLTIRTQFKGTGTFRVGRAEARQIITP